MLKSQTKTLAQIYNELYDLAKDKTKFEIDGFPLLFKYECSKSKEDKNKLLKFLKLPIENNYIINEDKDSCCGEEMIYNNNDCYFSCKHCGQTFQHADLKTDYKDEVQLTKAIVYNRNKHFKKQIEGLPIETQQFLSEMFVDVVNAFKTLKTNKKNLFHYNYIIYKLLEILDEHDLKQEYNLLKSRDRLKEIDIVWKEICKINNWLFYVTL